MIKYTIIVSVILGLLSCQKAENVRFNEEVSWIEQYVSSHSLIGYQIRETGIFIVHDHRSNLDLSPTLNNDLDVVLDLSCKDAVHQTVFFELATDTLAVDDLIHGLKIGLTHTSIGDSVQLYVPSRLAYGEEGLDNIPANTILKFDIYLSDIHPHF